MEKTFTFEKIPSSVEELKAMENYDLKDPFKTAAYCLLVLCAYNDNKENALAMFDELKGPSPLTPLDKQFINDRFMDGKGYIPFSYFNGSSPVNNYVPKTPFEITIEDNPYSYNQEGYTLLFVRSSGADSLREIKLRNKPSTGEWFVWNYEGLLMGIRTPLMEDKWA